MDKKNFRFFQFEPRTKNKLVDTERFATISGMPAAMEVVLVGGMAIHP
jgi:hypothetical protein